VGAHTGVRMIALGAEYLTEAPPRPLRRTRVAGQRAGQQDEREPPLRATIPADRQAPVARQPRQRPLDPPPVPGREPRLLLLVVLVSSAPRTNLLYTASVVNETVASFGSLDGPGLPSLRPAPCSGGTGCSRTTESSGSSTWICCWSPTTCSWSRSSLRSTWPCGEPVRPSWRSRRLWACSGSRCSSPPTRPSRCSR
jgi:hypothetical protein